MSKERAVVMIWVSTILACCSLGLSLAAIGLTWAVLAG